MVDQFIHSSLLKAKKSVEAFLANPEQVKKVQQAIEAMTKSFKNDGKVISCGNGGSFCDAQHFAEELTGKYCQDRASLPAISIADAGHITCVGNDYGFDFVYSRYIEAHGKKATVYSPSLLVVTRKISSMRSMSQKRKA